jgi:enoyl-CoA hydratase/carnithine racemase
LAQSAPLAVTGMKRALNGLTAPSLSEAESLELEEARRRAFASDDLREGKAAHREQRPPRFTGR